MINVSGENVYPKEIVDILLRHPNVRDASVVPLRHPIKGAVPVAFIVQSQNGDTSAEELKQFFLKYGAPYAYPRRIYFLDSMPLSGTGKVDRAQLAKLAAEFDEKVQHETA
jgi:acyl-coenzyme A synthetase/AMP-(fatty) acid ligase